LTWKLFSKATDVAVNQGRIALEGNESLDEGSVALIRGIKVAIVRYSASGGFPNPFYALSSGEYGGSRCSSMWRLFAASQTLPSASRLWQGPLSMIKMTLVL
jgi:hypothetical protein